MKLAQQVAMRLEEDIVGSGWKVGEIMGSEAALATRYGVSRWVIREALRIAEQDGLVEIRRGRFGGIAVSAPVLTVVGSSIRQFLSVSRVSNDVLYEARFVLECFAASLAIARLPPAQAESLRELAERASAAPAAQHSAMIFLILREVLRAAGNSALEAFTYALSQTTIELALLRGADEAELNHIASRQLQFRIKLIHAILAGDGASATEQINSFCQLGISFLYGLKQGKKDLALLVAQHHLIHDARNKTARPKLTEQVAWEIEYDLIANDWAPGTLLGSEAALMQRYKVSRSVIREAIRPLERLGVVEMCRGKHSGLKVATPEPSAIIRSVVLYLNYSKNNDFASYELRKEIERVVVQALAAAPAAARTPTTERLTAFSEFKFRASLGSLRQVVHDLGQIFAAATPNLIFSFFLRILAETVLLSSRCVLSVNDAATVIRTVQTQAGKLGRAIQGGESELARNGIDEIWDTLREAYDLPKKKARQDGEACQAAPPSLT
ncbi:MAG: GntR family transcriptional regulator [Rhodocyclaceae bacterium]|nr:GntR family transcriptional regulator [Rhodocyclaceae bacterium]